MVFGNSSEFSILNLKTHQRSLSKLKMLKRNKSEIWEDDALNRKSFYRTVSEVPQDETDTDDENETKTLRTTMKTVTSSFTLDDWQNAVLEKEKEIRLVAGT